MWASGSSDSAELFLECRPECHDSLYGLAGSFEHKLARNLCFSCKVFHQCTIQSADGLLFGDRQGQTIICKIAHDRREIVGRSELWRVAVGVDEGPVLQVHAIVSDECVEDEPLSAPHVFYGTLLHAAKGRRVLGHKKEND